MAKKTLDWGYKLLFTITILCVLAFSLIAYYTLKAAREDAQSVQHSKNVLVELEGLMGSIKDMEAANRAYVITDNKGFVEAYNEAKVGLSENYDDAYELVQGDKAQELNLQDIHTLLEERIKLMEMVAGLDSLQMEETSLKTDLIERGDSIMESIREIIYEMEGYEGDILGMHTQSMVSSDNKSMTMIVIFSLFTLAICIFSFIQINNEFKQKLKQQERTLKAEKATDSMESELDNLYDNSPDSIVMVDENGLIVGWNPAAERVFGYSEKEMMNQPIEKIKTKGQKLDDNAFIDGDVLELNYKKKNGDIFPVEVSFSQWNSHGETYYSEIIRDITAKQKNQQEKELLYSINSVIALADSFEGIVQTIIEKISLYFNFEYGEIWLPEKGILKHGHYSYIKDEKFNSFHTVSLDTTFEINKGSIGSVYSSKKTEWIEDIREQTEEEFSRKKAAEEVGLKTAITIPLLAENETQAVIAFYTDEVVAHNSETFQSLENVVQLMGIILKRRKIEDWLIENEALLREAEKMAGVGCWEWEMATNEVKWSDGLYNIYQLDKEKIIIDFDKYMGLIHPEERDGFQSTLYNAVETKDSFVIAHRAMLEDGSVIYIMCNGFPKFNERGELTGYLGTAKDATESKLAQLELKELNETLKQSNQNLQQFAYIASHDLQEPLRKIRAFSGRLKSKFEGTELPGQDYVERMEDAASRMQVLIDDLLIFSRTQRNEGKKTIEDLNSIVSVILSDLEIAINEAGAEIKIKKLPKVLQSNRTQMRQLFQNLVSNAIKFRKKEVVPKITIDSKLVSANKINVPGFKPEKGKKYYQITVQDNGIGFNMRYIDKVFGIFERLHGRSAYKGTGIGLAVCKQICQNHNGTLTAESEEGQGAAFVAYLQK